MLTARLALHFAFMLKGIQRHASSFWTFAAAFDSPLYRLAAWAGQVIQILAKADGDQYQAVQRICKYSLQLFTLLCNICLSPQVEDTETGILEDCKSCVRVTGAGCLVRSI